MIKKKISRLAALLVAFSMIFSLAACGSDSSSDESGESGSTASSSSDDAGTSDDTYDVVTFNALESESWDPMRESQSGNVIANMFEGLTAYENGELVLAVASSIDLSDDGMTCTITLREDAYWSDGQQVVAGDYEYAWLRQLDPENAAKYCSYLYCIANAEAYNSGEATADEVGIEVVNDFEIIVTMENPTTMTDFQEVLSNQVCMPVREDAVATGENWWADSSTCICNGPYKLESYTAGDSIVMVKNEYYYDADIMQIDELVVKFITDSQVELMAYENDELQIGIMPPSDSLSDFEESGELYSAAKITCYWLVLNCEDEVLSDYRVRQALSLSIDRESIVENVTKGGEIAAYSLISPQVVDQSTGESFNDVYGAWFEEDIEKAQELLAEAGYPNGEGFPTLTYGISSGSYHADIAQAIAAMWEENLGITVEIIEEETSVFISDRKNGEFQIARYTNSSVFTSPSAMLELYIGGGENNDSFYANDEYDALVAAAAATSDVDERYDYYQQANQMLMEDMAVIPLFYPVNNYIIKTNLKGVGINNGGRLDFKYAYYED